MIGARALRQCARCGAPIDPCSRADRRTCSTRCRVATRRATTVGYGPRFLHSTGQLHKGGAPIGWFLQLIAEHPDDREIPGKAYSFGQLIDAQAIGDARTLGDHHLPVLRLNLGADPDAGLDVLARALAAALRDA